MNGESTSDARLTDVERTLRAIDACLAAVEAIASRAAASDEAAEPDTFHDPPKPPGTHTPAVDGVAVMTLAGRTLVVLGGAYLLRALTEAAFIADVRRRAHRRTALHAGWRPIIRRMKRCALWMPVGFANINMHSPATTSSPSCVATVPCAS